MTNPELNLKMAELMRYIEVQIGEITYRENMGQYPFIVQAGGAVKLYTARAARVVDWNPAENIGQAMECVEQARKNRIFVQVNPDDQGFKVHHYASGQLVFSDFPSLPATICRVIVGASQK